MPTQATSENKTQRRSALRQDAPPWVPGNATEVLFTSPKIGMVSESARYILVEASRVYPSHIPHEGPGVYRTNPRYPEGLQERRYHVDLAEVQKVRDNARNFRPSLVLNSNPDAVNGPPIVDKNFLVLGGNSRTMSMQLLYEQQKDTNAKSRGERLIKQRLKRLCDLGCFGFSLDDVEAMERPILVRQINLDARAEKERGKRWVRLLNETLTQELDASTSKVALGTKITPNEWRSIARTLTNTMSESDTIGRYLLSPRSDILVKKLADLGVINDRNRSRLQRPNGALTREGRQLIKELLFGHLIKSPDLIDTLGDQAINVLEAVAPYLLMTEVHKEWSLMRDVPVVLAAIHRLSTERVRSADGRERSLKTPEGIALAMGQGSLFGEATSPYSAIQRNSKRKLLFHVMYANRRSSRELSRGFRQYAQAARGQNDQQGLLGGILQGGGANEPVQALAQAFQMQPDPSSPTGYRTT